MNKKIAIIDYGFGNIESLKNAINYLNFECEIITNPKKFNEFTHAFLPGVGSFESGIKVLKKKRWNIALKEFLENGNKLFGICLGMQLLFEKGTNEKNQNKIDGLNFLKGTCEKFFEGKKKVINPLPHIGFNKVNFKKTKLWKTDSQMPYFYFIHSYRVKDAKNYSSLGITDYGEKFISYLEDNNIFCSQFHPEKSHIKGLKLIENFILL